MGLLCNRCLVAFCSALDSVKTLVAVGGLQPHPEGGWYRELQRSSITVVRPDGQQRNAITTVLFLLGADNVSRWHCVHGGDEIWTFLAGAPLSLFQHSDAADGSQEQVVSADPACDLGPGGGVDGSPESGISVW